ncbi:hypothetical protein QEN19_000542 [Hanseniaspora menglaensis]
MAFTSAETFSKKDIPQISNPVNNTDKVKRELIDCTFKQYLQYQCQHVYETNLTEEDGSTKRVTSKVLLDSNKSDFQYVCIPFIRLFRNCKEIVKADGAQLYKNRSVEVTDTYSNDEVLLSAVENSRPDIVKYHQFK